MTIKRLTRSHKGLQPWLAKRIFSACVIPIIFYGIAAWGQCETKQFWVNIVQRIYRMGAIMILGLLRTTSFETSVMLAGLRPPQQESLLRLMTLKDQVERIGMVLEESKIKTHL